MNSEKDVKEVIKGQWDKRGSDYDRSPGHGIHSEHEKEAWKSLLRQALGTENAKLDVLDVGCGTGVISLLLAELEHSVTGIDLSEGMREKAKEKARTFNFPIEFKNGDAENLPFEDEAFDVVINRHLLWALPNPEKAISEWKRVLKPGGKLVVIDGNWDGHKGLNEQIWRYLVLAPLITTTERRNPFHGHYDQDTKKKLPMRYKKTKESNRDNKINGII